MRSLGIEPDKIVSQLLVELPWILKEMCIPVNKLFLDGSIEAFAMRIHFWRSWIRMPVWDRNVIKLGLKRFHELTAVVCQYLFDFVWKTLKDCFEYMGSFFGSVASGRVCDGKARIDVRCCDQISP